MEIPDRQKMLTANKEQKQELEENIRKLKETERVKVQELQRQREQDKRNNEAELQRMRRKYEVIYCFLKF